MEIELFTNFLIKMNINIIYKYSFEKDRTKMNRTRYHSLTCETNKHLLSSSIGKEDITILNFMHCFAIALNSIYL